MSACIRKRPFFLHQVPDQKQLEEGLVLSHGQGVTLYLQSCSREKQEVEPLANLEARF